MRRALLLLVCACSGSVHHGIDAGPADASTDTLAPSDDPPAGAVTLTITRGGAPVAGVAVMFQGADSSLVHAALTNTKGVAWAQLPSGGFVTALEHRGAGLDELTTFAAVAAGDALVLDFDPTGARDEAAVALSVPADSNGATAYQLYTTCGGPIGVDPAAATTTTLVGCGPVTDAIVVAEDADGQPLRALFASDVIVPESPVTDPPTFMPVTVTGSYASLVPATFSYSNVPANVTFVATYHAFATSHGRVFERTAGETVAGGTAQTTIALPAASTGSLVGTVLYAADVGTQSIYDARAAGSPAYALDVGAALLPAFASPPSFAAGAVTWTEASGAVQPELVRARIHVYRDDIPTGRAWGWRIIAPRTGTSVAYPTLPSFGFDFNPASTDTVGVDELTTATVPGSYSARIGFGELGSLVIGTTERSVVQMLSAAEP